MFSLGMQLKQLKLLFWKAAAWVGNETDHCISKSILLHKIIFPNGFFVHFSIAPEAFNGILIIESNFPCRYLKDSY